MQESVHPLIKISDRPSEMKYTHRTRVELERAQRCSLGQSDDNDIRLPDHLGP